MSLVLEDRLNLTCEYDAEDDTLYAWVGEKPTAAITYETDEGHLVRLDPETKAFVGVTIFDFEARWRDDPITLNWAVEIERPIPWLPWFARKQRERVEKKRVLRHVSEHAPVC